MMATLWYILDVAAAPQELAAQAMVIETVRQVAASNGFQFKEGSARRFVDAWSVAVLT